MKFALISNRLIVSAIDVHLHFRPAIPASAHKRFLAYELHDDISRSFSDSFVLFVSFVSFVVNCLVAVYGEPELSRIPVFSIVSFDYVPLKVDLFSDGPQTQLLLKFATQSID